MQLQIDSQSELNITTQPLAVGTPATCVVPRKYHYDEASRGPTGYLVVSCEPDSLSTIFFALDQAKELATAANDTKALALINAQYPE